MPAKKPRITGVSGLGFGAEWEWVETDAEAVRKLIVFLEGKRALTYSHIRGDVYYVTQSVLEMRAELTTTLQTLSAKSGAAPAVRAMRSACLRFLDRSAGMADSEMNPEFVLALGELRGVFAVSLRDLADRYQVPVYDELGDMLSSVDVRSGE